MRVLVTGARGLLASAIVSEFSTSADVIPLDRRALDITDAAATRRTCDQQQPDVIVNCAVFNGVDRAEDEPVAALSANALAVEDLAAAAASAGAVLIHFSSDFVFDGETDRPYTEADRPNPQSVYGASKLLGDWLALESPRAYVLRVESLFGPPPPGGRRGSLATIVDRIREGGEVPAFVDRVVSPSYTPHVARATRWLLETAAPFGLYHCVNTGNATWSQIGAHAAASLALPYRMRPITLATAGLRARRPRFCALDNAKLAAAGFRMPTWQDALREFLATVQH